MPHRGCLCRSTLFFALGPRSICLPGRPKHGRRRPGGSVCTLVHRRDLGMETEPRSRLWRPGDSRTGDSGCAASWVAPLPGTCLDQHQAVRLPRNTQHETPKVPL
jgi:hypothetical protein